TGLAVFLAGRRWERRADLIDRPVRRPGIAPLCPGKRWFQYRRRPPGLSSRRHRALAQERLPRCGADPASVDPRATGLLLRLQRARGDLPEHVPRHRGARARRMEALRVSVAWGS